MTQSEPSEFQGENDEEVEVNYDSDHAMNRYAGSKETLEMLDVQV